MAWTCYPHWKGWRATANESRGEDLSGLHPQAIGFWGVTLNRFSSGVPDRCQILGTLGSNPWPSDCRWASALCQKKSESAGRCSLLYFLWSRSLCWSEIKQHCPAASYTNTFWISFATMWRTNAQLQSRMKGAGTMHTAGSGKGKNGSEDSVLGLSIQFSSWPILVSLNISVCTWRCMVI